MDSPEIRPEPEEAERKAILAALAAAEAERAAESRVSRWGESVLPARDADEAEP